MEPILSVEHLRRDYGGRGSVTHAVDDVSFSVERGEFVGIMGASGSGKSTLLNCIATIDTPTAGHIRVEGQEVTPPKGRSPHRRPLPVPYTHLTLPPSPYAIPTGGLLTVAINDVSSTPLTLPTKA